MALRPYTREEIWNAAAEHGVDPVLAEAIYMRESSSGKDPKAMGVRYVRYPKGGGGTYIRGPFQMSDDTARGVIRNNKLGKVDLDDPDAHLDLAMRLMKELKGQYGDDPAEIARGFHGGPTGVKNPNVKDELGTSSGGYAQDILRNMAMIRAEGTGGPMVTRAPAVTPDAAPSDYDPTADRIPPGLSADAGGTDMFGMPTDMGIGSWKDFLADAGVSGGREFNMGIGSWKDFLADARGGDLSQPVVGLGIPEEMGGDMPMNEPPPAGGFDVDQYLASLVNDQMKDRDFNAVA
jgi:hypothetical protein